MRLPNKYGSIHKLSGNRRKPWRVRVTIGYKENATPLYFNVGYYETYSTALQGLADYHNDPSLYQRKDWTVERVYNVWFETKKHNVSNSTIHGYELAYTYCSPLLKIPFSDVKMVDLQKIVDTMGTKFSVKKKFKELFNQLYDFAIANDICVKKYSTYIDVGKSTKSNMHRPFAPDEIELLWNNVYKVPFVDVILIYIYTGFRPIELLKLKNSENVNLTDNYLQGGVKTEAGKNRIIPIHHKILELIKNLYDKNNEYLITDKDGNPLTYRQWSYQFHKALEVLNINNHTPHDPRHTFATRLDNVNANSLCVKRLMGHASNDVTYDVYTHKNIEELREAIELLS